MRKENRIGVLGVCAGGGYAVNAAMTNAVSQAALRRGANIGRVQRESRNPIPVLKEAARQRTPEARWRAPCHKPDSPQPERKGEGGHPQARISWCWNIKPLRPVRPAACEAKMEERLKLWYCLGKGAVSVYA
ncbi:MAG: hypothetical protein ACLR0U_08230 [Enterocloster clostridioformis]